MQKEVKIIGLSVAKNFGGLKATELAFDEKNRLTVIKGEVGSGKTTLNRAMRLTTQGSSVLRDKNLYGEIDITTQLIDGDTNIFVGCRTDKAGVLSYFLYSVNADGEKITDVVIDGKRATPANYLKSLQTALTWRLDELTSESHVTQRNILLELYQKELEDQGVIFDKAHPNYTKGIIHKIETAKDQRNYADMKRKEVGGIADDLNAKGINYEDRRTLKNIDDLKAEILKIESKISIAETNVEQAKESELNAVKLQGVEVLSTLKDLAQQIIDDNKKTQEQSENLKQVNLLIDKIITESNRNKLVKETLLKNIPAVKIIQNELQFSENKCTSKAEDFKNNQIIHAALDNYKKVQKKYKKIKKRENEVDNTGLIKQLGERKQALEATEIYNKEALAVNSFQDWKDANEHVTEIKKDYYLKLTEIDTGVKGLHICPDENSDVDNIYLMYDGSYDIKYFNNPKKELRKLSSYSGTQKPMICLLIQSHLLSKKQKTLPYLWIDDVPIDKKTRKLLEKMAEELGLWLFVNWTGDFASAKLKDGEILLENGEIFIKND